MQEPEDAENREKRDRSEVVHPVLLLQGEWRSGHGDHSLTWVGRNNDRTWGVASPMTAATVADMSEREDAQRLAAEARDRVRFEEDALALADQVYRVARHLANSREDAEELVQETYVRAFRSWA